MRRIFNNLPLILLVLFVMNLMANNFLHYIIEEETKETLIKSSYIIFGLMITSTIIKKFTGEKKPKPKKTKTSKCGSCGKKSK